jgi:hypothetical protein
MKLIKGFSAYGISEEGDLYSYKNGRWGVNFGNPKKLKGWISTPGYKETFLTSDEGVKCVRQMHRLVAEMYLPDPTIEQIQVNHKNGIKTDNRPLNLEWCTCKENLDHAKNTGLRKDATAKTSPLSIPITALNTETNEVFYCDSIGEASKLTNKSKCYTWSMVNGKRPSGKWKFTFNSKVECNDYPA